MKKNYFRYAKAVGIILNNKGRLSLINLGLFSTTQTRKKVYLVRDGEKPKQGSSLLKVGGHISENHLIIIQNEGQEFCYPAISTKWQSPKLSGVVHQDEDGFRLSDSGQDVALWHHQGLIRIGSVLQIDPFGEELDRQIELLQTQIPEATIISSTTAKGSFLIALTPAKTSWLVTEIPYLASEDFAKIISSRVSADDDEAASESVA